MRSRQLVLQSAIWIPFLITTALWVLAKTERPAEPLTAISQILSLWVMTAFSLVMLIAARSRAVEKIYGGLDKSYALHGQMAKAAWGLMLLHPLLLIPGRAAEGIPWFSLLLPIGPWPAGFELARLMGVLAYYLFIALVLLTLWRKVDYQHWLLSHKLMGPAFAFATAHTFMAASDVRAFEPLRTWMVVVCGVGILAWLYKSLLYPYLAKHYIYRVQSLVEKGGGVWELNLKPTGARMNYEPGEFAFISVRGNPNVPAEPHPFSISSSSHQHGLRFSFRTVGDYTRKLPQTKEGDEVVIYGPYGEFTSYMLDDYKRQVWIGGGIGITPFLSMAAHEALTGDEKEITCYCSVKKPADAVYHEEMERAAAAHPRLTYIRHCSDDEGFLNVERFRKEVGDLSDVAWLFCGPPIMMQSLRKQLIAAGISPDQIFFEEFNFV